MESVRSFKRQRRVAIRDFLRGIPFGIFDLTYWQAKLPVAVFLMLGAVWAWCKQDEAMALLEELVVVSPLLKVVLGQLFHTYILFAILALLLLLVYPLGRRVAEEDLQRAGLTNHAGEPPHLLHRKRDREHTNVTIWTFDGRGIPLQQWQDKQGQVEAALDVAIVNIKTKHSKRRVLLYTVPAKDDLPGVIAWKDRFLSENSFVLTLGESIMGVVTVDLARIPHILLGGSTGSGKSVLLKLLLMQALRKGAEVYISDFKGGVDFPQIWHSKCKMCFEEENLLQTLDHLVNALEQRKQLFRSLGCANIDIYNKVEECSLPRMIFACDEVAEILDRTGADTERKKLLAQIESKLSTIARQGRAFGIHLILATQRPDATVIPGQIRSNMDCRICGRADNILSQIILDNTRAAEQIPKDARGRFITGDGTVFQGYLFDENNL